MFHLFTEKDFDPKEEEKEKEKEREKEKETV